jgi:hypothetical protein
MVIFSAVKLKELFKKAAMSHKYHNQGSVGMFCHFLSDSFRRYSKKIACGDIFARYN